ncbi:MAG TPA: hypothetical protein DCZ75_05795 [Geobacter sp.]|nr:hypothetical protein [Geobacter sp.]
MNVTADPMPTRENMIKRFNNFILSSLKKVRLRSVGAVLLGATAGVSFNATVLPTAVSSLGLTDEFSARWALGGYAVYTLMVWAVGAWTARRTGNTALGGAVLGLVGLVSGALLAGAAFGTGLSFLLAGGGSGLIYGGIGGMLIANSLQTPCGDA